MRRGFSTCCYSRCCRSATAAVAEGGGAGLQPPSAKLIQPQYFCRLQHGPLSLGWEPQRHPWECQAFGGCAPGSCSLIGSWWGPRICQIS